MTSLTPDHVARKHVSFRPKNTDAPPLRKHLCLRSLGENISSQRVGKSGKKDGEIRWMQQEGSSQQEKEVRPYVHQTVPISFPFPRTTYTPHTYAEL